MGSLMLSKKWFIIMALSVASLLCCATPSHVFAAQGFKKFSVSSHDLTYRSKVTYPASSGSFSWDSESATLTLDNAVIECDPRQYAIFIKSLNPYDAITIYLIGENRISCSGSDAIHLNCGLLITGDTDASLKVETDGMHYGIYAGGSIAIDGTSVYSDAWYPAIYTPSDITISDSAIYASSTGGAAIYSGAILDISGSSSVINASGYYSALTGISGIAAADASINASSVLPYTTIYSDGLISLDDASVNTDPASQEPYFTVSAVSPDDAVPGSSNEAVASPDASALSDASVSGASSDSSLPAGQSQIKPPSAVEKTDSTDAVMISPPTGESDFIVVVALLLLFTGLHFSVSSQPAPLCPHGSLRK